MRSRSVGRAAPAAARAWSPVERAAAAVCVVAALLIALTSARAGAQAATPVAAYAVAAHDLPRGHVLTAEDVRPAPRAPRSPLVGWTTRRVIAAGEPLRAPAVAPPADTPNAATPAAAAPRAGAAVRAGQKVAVVYRDAGLELRLAGVAAQDGAVGARVAVRLPSQGSGQAARRLDVTVVAPGVVRVR